MLDKIVDNISREKRATTLKEMQKRIDDITKIKKIQLDQVKTDKDPYMVGLANGLILADYTLNPHDLHRHPYERGPKFITCKKEHYKKS